MSPLNSAGSVIAFTASHESSVGHLGQIFEIPMKYGLEVVMARTKLVDFCSSCVGRPSTNLPKRSSLDGHLQIVRS